MATQSEEQLEVKLIQQLQTLGYDYVEVKDEASLLSNLKKQLEKHNGIQLTQKEFELVLNHLNKGGIFDRAKILRDRLQYEKDDGTTGYLQFLNLEHWCQNEFQVTRQVTMDKGKYTNRYDVTLLINGLPLVQVELKKRGLELKEAYNQIQRYKKHSFWSSHGLFQYVQIFVISNGVNTKYFANNPASTFKQTNFWANIDNKKITQLQAFAEVFLEKCHLAKMICKYIVLEESTGLLMVLRPYQFHAVEGIIERVRNSTKNGYIWHTTGSGKTLTSFKASQILVKLPQVHKVVFVVDRRDLDAQTIREFDKFQKGSVDSSDNTNVLVQQFTDTYKTPGTKEPKQVDLIVTTIQKLNNAIKNRRYLKRMETVQNKNYVFIFDECHRSQFGDTHNRIKAFFTNHQMFGFTGTPIFADNASRNELGKRTTKDLFGDCLHKYVITDAIRDQNVLRFSVEYYKVFRQKEEAAEKPDQKVEAIDTQEVLESDQYIEEVVDYIIQQHDRKTHQRQFSAIFCVSRIPMLIKYYELFKKKKEAGEHDLRVVTIFSYGVNEDDESNDGDIPDTTPNPDDNSSINTHSRDKMDEFIADYNAMFGTKFSTKDSQQFYNYYKDIGQKLKNREKRSSAAINHQDRIDVLLVVNMFLTGFDAKKINTMYVDKNLKQHGLIQAFSRTNRIIGEKKTHGFIICFRNLKKATDEAVTLFSNKNALEEILMEPYEHYVGQFKIALAELKEIAPEIESVDDFYSEDDELEFVKAFRKIIRLKNLMSGFTEFSLEELGLDEQEFADYKSKYLDLYRKVKDDIGKQKESILDDIDFEIELIQRDEINVSYILRLLADLMNSKDKDKDKKRQVIVDMLSGEVQLQSKKKLIEKFIEWHLPKIKDTSKIPDAFAHFWNLEKQSAFDALCKEEDLKPQGLFQLLQNYLYTGRQPLKDDVRNLRKKPLAFFEILDFTERIIGKILSFTETFEDGMGDVEVSAGRELMLPEVVQGMAAEGEET